MEELNCEMVRDLLPSFDEGLLHDSVRDAVSAHLETCPSCVSALTAYRQRARLAKLRGEDHNQKYRKSTAAKWAFWKSFIIAFLLSLIGTLIIAFILPALCVALA